MSKISETICYFSAEIGLSSSIPTYSGGLGVLAGDYIKASADLNLPVIGITLLYRHGQGIQRINRDGVQKERWNNFNPDGILKKEEAEIKLKLDGKEIIIEIWSKTVNGVRGHKGKVFFLDVNHHTNTPEHRNLGSRLYGGGTETRIRQEYILGFGGVKTLKVLGFWPLKGFHLNEGHTSFVALSLMDEGLSINEIKNKLHFTTHTPVPAGHDVFDMEEVRKVLGSNHADFCSNFTEDDKLSMSHLAINVSNTCNAVSKLNAKVAKDMFPGKQIGSITNGVHHLTWTSVPLAKLYDKELPGWRVNPDLLSDASKLNSNMLWQAHLTAKKSLIRYANSMSGKGLSPERLTICFARRIVEYKRPNLILKDIERLIEICENKVQFIFAGYAHPNNIAGKKIIKELNEATDILGNKVNFVYLENYSMWLGSKLVSGADIWLNNPIRPLEACGTSGMKASMNGVLNFSVSDGWWDEEANNGKNGWIIGNKNEESDDIRDSKKIYDILEKEIIPLWENDRNKWIKMMKCAISTSSKMTAKRMVKEYQNYYDNFGSHQ